ncbi:hypothetical protein HPB49_009359 [Dermacentor silvarum]|uniref:Uncharacterized protein n=1 Tax=Dermacentor silvarum TaxID=543639 RepID=A0ACB8CQM0_DERSI|nr:hypothetical protein HPB49_009359 [Dermacentor silvarum]
MPTCAELAKRIDQLEALFKGRCDEVVPDLVRKCSTKLSTEPNIVELKGEMEAFIKSVDMLNSIVEDARAQNISLTSANKELKAENEALTKRLSELEQHSRINNVEIKGVIERRWNGDQPGPAEAAPSQRRRILAALRHQKNYSKAEMNTLKLKAGAIAPGANSTIEFERTAKTSREPEPKGSGVFEAPCPSVTVVSATAAEVIHPEAEAEGPGTPMASEDAVPPMDTDSVDLGAERPKTPAASEATDLSTDAGKTYATMTREDGYKDDTEALMDEEEAVETLQPRNINLSSWVPGPETPATKKGTKNVDSPVKDAAAVSPAVPLRTAKTSGEPEPKGSGLFEAPCP